MDTRPAYVPCDGKPGDDRVLRVNQCTGTIYAIPLQAAVLYDKFILRQIQFENEPPFLDSPEFKEWCALKDTLANDYIEVYRALVE